MSRILLTIIAMAPFCLFGQNCNKIEHRIDKYSGEENLQSPAGDDIIFLKYPSKDRGSDYVMHLTAYGSTAVAGGGKAIILFTDGSKLEFDHEVDLDYSPYKGKYSYSALVVLKQDEVKILCSKEIDGFKLYVFENDLKPREANKYKGYINCLVGMDI